MDVPVLNTDEALERIGQALAQNKPCQLVVTGGSMVPFLRHRKSAVLLGSAEAPYRRGEILFYQRPSGQCILHRVHRVMDDGTLIMYGDAQTYPERIAPQQVLARATHVRRGTRFVPCTSLPLRFLVALWQALLPVREPLLAVMVGVRKLFGGKPQP